MASAAQLIAEALLNADGAATLWLNSLHCPAGDAFWIFLSRKAVWIPLYVAVVAFLFVRLGWRKALLAIGLISLTILSTDQLCGVFKNWICRPRPCFDEAMLAGGLHLPIGSETSPYGFFSAHAANAFGFASSSFNIFRSDKKRSYRAYGWGIMIWATLVSLSRIFLGRHFLGDIIFGAAVGLLIGWLFALVFRVICSSK
ncbi:phosphatase PAP2 family protein [bacterium]|nr:phosphatase PAP2 family protein [bacterium]